MKTILLSLLVICVGARCEANLVVYSNDFDGNVQTSPGTSVNISGGTGTGGGIAGGITSSQGYAAHSNFGGNFWRVTAPDDVLQFDITNIPSHTDVSVCFSLAMIDSWDGTSGAFGTDIINVAIFDGATQIGGLSEAYSSNNAPSSNVESVIVQDQQLGFNLGEPFWHEDGYRMCFNNLTHSSGSLTLEFWGSSGGTGSGFQGGDDESFAIDELVVTSSPEPASLMYLLLASILTVMRRPGRQQVC